ncbi:hypothetical protein HBI17_218110 [Parastagonospora nodorum]|nr:hypothetical protein HBI17_218110 [Parastagonospora nodorum]
MREESLREDVEGLGVLGTTLGGAAARLLTGDVLPEAATPGFQTTAFVVIRDGRFPPLAFEAPSASSTRERRETRTESSVAAGRQLAKIAIDPCLVKTDPAPSTDSGTDLGESGGVELQQLLTAVQSIRCSHTIESIHYAENAMKWHVEQ